jgi:hypothetical protein
MLKQARFFLSTRSPFLIPAGRFPPARMDASTPPPASNAAAGAVPTSPVTMKKPTVSIILWKSEPLWATRPIPVAQPSAKSTTVSRRR